MTRNRELMKQGEAKWMLVASLNTRKAMAIAIEKVLSAMTDALKVDAELEPAHNLVNHHD